MDILKEMKKYLALPLCDNENRQLPRHIKSYLLASDSELNKQIQIIVFVAISLQLAAVIF
jgi:hypothetical protein